MKVLKKIFQILFKIINTLLIILSFALVFIAIFKKEWFEFFIEQMRIIVGGLGYWNYFIVFFSALAEAFPVLGILVPGQNILLVIGGFFGEISYYNLILVIIVAGAGAIAGNHIGYMLGKKYGDSFFEKYGLWFGIGMTEVKYLKQGIEKWGPLGITFGKFHPLTRSFLPFIAGSMGMKSNKFMLYNAIGSFLWSTTMIVFGVIFVKYYQIFLDNALYITLIILAIVGSYIYFFKKEEFLIYWRDKNDEIEKRYGLEDKK